LDLKYKNALATLPWSLQRFPDFLSGFGKEREMEKAGEIGKEG